MISACGGRFDGEPSPSAELPTMSEPDSRSGAAGAAGEASPDVGSAAAGDAHVSRGSGGAEMQAGGAEAQAAGAGGAEARPALIGSGTRYCEDERYCFGFSCYAPFSESPRACIATCADDTDCRTGEVCLQSKALRAGCYAACETPFDCAHNFDCFDFAGLRQSLVCFPHQWATAWERGDL